MGLEVAIPQWDDVSAWDKNRNLFKGDDNPVLQFILDNEPAGEEGQLFRKQLVEMLEWVGTDAIEAYRDRLDDWFQVQWDDHYYALNRVLLEKQEEHLKVDYSENVR